MYNKCPESSETGCMKLSTVYLHSSVRDFLRNSFCLNVLLSVFLGGSLKQSWKTMNTAELFRHGHLDGPIVRIAMVFQCSLQSWE